MAGTALSAVMGIPDTIGTFRFSFFITLPTGLQTIGTTRDLHLRTQSCELPGRQVEVMQVPMHGQPERHFRGRGIFTGSLPINFIETSDGLTHLTLHEWMETIVGSNSGNGNFSATYATNAVVNVLGPDGSAVQQATIFNIWPTQIPDVLLDGTNSTPYMVNSVWAYDYVSWSAEITEDTAGTTASVT